MVQVFVSFQVHDIENGELSSVKCITELQETVPLYPTDPIDKEAITTTMKRAKPTPSTGSNEKKTKSSKKLKAGITSDDTNMVKSKNVNNKRVGKAVTGDQTKNKTKNISNVKKTVGWFHHRKQCITHINKNTLLFIFLIFYLCSLASKERILNLRVL